MDTPVVSRLHPRTATVTWAPPAPPNGIITNYTVCLCPSSVCSRSTALNSSANPNSTSWSDDVGKDVSEENSSSVQDSRPSSIFSSKSSVTKDWQTKSPVEGGRNGSNLTEPNSASMNPTPTSLSASSQAFLVTEHSLTSGCFSSASGSSSYLQSVTVSGNNTSYTFLDLRPYQTYSSQVRTGHYHNVASEHVLECLFRPQGKIRDGGLQEDVSPLRDLTPLSVGETDTRHLLGQNIASHKACQRTLPNTIRDIYGLALFAHCWSANSQRKTWKHEKQHEQ